MELAKELKYRLKLPSDILSKDHGVRPLHAIIADVELVVGDVVKNQRHCGGFPRLEKSKGLKRLQQ